MIDFSTEYLGLKLKGPIVVSSTPLSESVDNLHRMEEAGAAAVVLPSLFEEQLILESQALDADLERGTNSFAESLDYLPDSGNYRMTEEVYLQHLRRAKDAVKIPVLGSMNGITPGGWIRYAKEIEQAGADALELNTFALATNRSHTSADLELQIIKLVEQVTKSVRIPVAVKLSPTFTSLPFMASCLADAGARGIVLFNRFYEPDFDIETLEVRPTLRFSSSAELLTRLHWTAILFGQVKTDFAITGGVHTAEDVLKSIMAGANVAMMTSALHLHGIEHIGRVMADLVLWLEKHEVASLATTRGSLSRRALPDTSPYDRGNYIKTLSSYSLAIK
ncbi:MAG: dihydroorotate dehydrogenase-like protein [Acidobacteriaceae bacterium]|nr:dihydroorotate dehydrogenase-like protein [Acidobacteriaceae bacterium]